MYVPASRSPGRQYAPVPGNRHHTIETDNIRSFTHLPSPVCFGSHSSPSTSPAHKAAETKSHRALSPFVARAIHSLQNSSGSGNLFAPNSRAQSSTSPVRNDSMPAPRPRDRGASVTEPDASVLSSQRSTQPFQDTGDGAGAAATPPIPAPAINSVPDTKAVSHRLMQSAPSSLEYTGPPVHLGNSHYGDYSQGGHASHRDGNRGLLETIDAVLGVADCSPLLTAVSGLVRTAMQRVFMDMRAHVVSSRAGQLRRHVEGLIKPLLLTKAKLFAIVVQLVLGRHLRQRQLDTVHTWRAYALKQVILCDHKEFSVFRRLEQRRVCAAARMERIIDHCIRRYFRALVPPSGAKSPTTLLFRAISRIFERRLSIGWRLFVAGFEYTRAKHALVQSLAVASRPAHAGASIQALVSSILGATPAGESLLSQSRHFSSNS